MKKLILLLLISLTVAQLSAQRREPVCRSGGCEASSSRSRSWSLFRKHQFDSNNIIKYKLEYIQGRIIDYEERITPLIKDDVAGFEFALEFPKYGGEDWHFFYSFPTLGWGFRYLDLGNPDFLGSSYTFYPYLNIPIINSQLFTFNFKMGAGGAYLTKKFDPNFPLTYDQNNYAISSNLNFFLDLGLNAEMKLSKSQRSFISRFSLTGDVEASHTSNSSIRKPNAGLNILTGAVGIKYSPYLNAVPLKASISRLDRKWFFEPVLAVGMNRQHLSDSKDYLNASFNLGAYRPLTNVYRFGIGLDVFYNEAFFAERVLPAYYAGETDKLRGGLSLANELMFGDFIAGVHAGAYLINQIEHDGMFYFKLVTKYKVYDNFFLTAAVKTNMDVAENIEVGVGYSFFKKEKAPFSWLPEKQKKEKKRKDPEFSGPKRKQRMY